MGPWDMSPDQSMQPMAAAAPSGAYPTFPNQHGVGSQTGYQPPAPPMPAPSLQSSFMPPPGGAIEAAPPQMGASGPMSLSKPLTGGPGNVSSGATGFNPWSLTGESNARSQ